MLVKLISENQSGFVSGRLITDNVMLTQAIIHGIDKENKGGNVVLKLDIAKAYDRLSWSFLIKVLNKFGFNNEWTDLIWRNISNVWYSIIINGTRHGFFTSTQGLKQGDPISPSLFIIFAEVLSRALNSLVYHDNFIPFSMHKNGPQITHLAYADDIVIFSSGISKSVKLIMTHINNYENMSGQKVNKDKSFFLTSPKTCAYKINRIRSCTGFLESNFPLLTCPIYTSKKRIGYFDGMVTKVIKRLNSWQGNILSCGGRQVLIKSVIQSLSIYILSAVNPPKGTLELIEKHMANFFWGAVNGKNIYYWSSWENLYFPKNEGGIGLRKMRDIANILAVKRWWHFKEKKSLCSDFFNC